MTVLEALGIVVAAALTVNFALYLRSGELVRDLRVLRVLRRGRWGPAWLGAMAVLGVVVSVGTALVLLWPSVMGWTWLRLLATPGEAPQAGQNLMAAGLRVPGFAWVFLALLALNVPRLAINEEYVFRRGKKTCPEISWASLKFGLAHCLVGIPLGYGFALAIVGYWFAGQYLRGGLKRAAAYHILHNWTILALVAVWMLLHEIA